MSVGGGKLRVIKLFFWKSIIRDCDCSPQNVISERKFVKLVN